MTGAPGGGVDVNRLIFYVLRGGVALSLAIVLVGLALLAAGRPMFAGTCAARPGGLCPGRIPAELAAGSPAGFLGLGVLLLILTPVARVFMSIVYFAKEHDRAYVAITLAVFLILMAGIAVGLR